MVSAEEGIIRNCFLGGGVVVLGSDFSCVMWLIETRTENRQGPRKSGERVSKGTSEDKSTAGCALVPFQVLQGLVHIPLTSSSGVVLTDDV